VRRSWYSVAAQSHGAISKDSMERELNSMPALAPVIHEKLDHLELISQFPVTSGILS